MKKIKGSDFVFESVELMDYKLHRVRLKRGGSCIKSLDWLENKKAIINLKKKMMMMMNAFGGQQFLH